MSRSGGTLFVVVEGLDGVGKSTVVSKLARQLDAVELRTPSRELALHRDSILRVFADSPLATTMFYLASVLAGARDVMRWQAQGRNVVMDRYYLSTLVYGEVVRGSEYPNAELDAFSKWLIPADLTVYLHANPDCRLRRMQARGVLGVEDRLSFEPKIAQLLDDGYRRRRNHSVVGQFLPVDAGCQSVDDIVLLIQHWIWEHRLPNPPLVAEPTVAQGGAP
jgi:dTMP kinase